MSQKTHTQLVKSLRPEERRALTTQNDQDGLSRMAVHFGLILGFGLYIALGGPFWWVLLIPQGYLIVFTFTLLHETTHDTPFANDSLNRWAGWICGFLNLLPPLWFRYFHMAHHRYTNVAGKDPELSAPKPQSRSEYIKYISGLPQWASKLRTLFNIANGQVYDYVPASARVRIKQEASIYILLYLLALGLLLAGWGWIFWCWALPALLGEPFLRAYLLAEHGRCPEVANMFENTRTTYTARLIRYFAWNMPYHAEHHAYPSVPFHSLPALHEIAQDHLKVTAKGYRRFNQNYYSKLKT